MQHELADKFENLFDTSAVAIGADMTAGYDRRNRFVVWNLANYDGWQDFRREYPSLSTLPGYYKYRAMHEHGAFIR